MIKRRWRNCCSSKKRMLPFYYFRWCITFRIHSDQSICGYGTNDMFVQW